MLLFALLVLLPTVGVVGTRIYQHLYNVLEYKRGFDHLINGVPTPNGRVPFDGINSTQAIAIVGNLPARAFVLGQGEQKRIVILFEIGPNATHASLLKPPSWFSKPDEWLAAKARKVAITPGSLMTKQEVELLREIAPPVVGVAGASVIGIATYDTTQDAILIPSTVELDGYIWKSKISLQGEKLEVERTLIDRVNRTKS